jgi:hypothetical protein
VCVGNLEGLGKASSGATKTGGSASRMNKSGALVLLDSVYFHIISHLLGPLSVTWASHNMVVSGS